jgi:ribosome-associated translation inhibitor RaiA
MDIIIKSINFKASSALKTLVKKKVGKLFNHRNNIIRANVILRERKNGSFENRQCKIKLEVPGNDHIVKKKTKVHEKSVLQAVEALQKILRRKKTKLIAKRQNQLLINQII